MQEILSAPRPYELIKEADNLISSVSAVNLSLLNERRAEVIAKIDSHIAALDKDLAIAQGGASLQAACLEPLTSLRERVQKQDSLAHITQAESQALEEFDVAVGRIESVVTEQKKPKSDSSEESTKPAAVVRKQRIIKPTEIMKAAYLETPDDVNNFLNALRQELENALANNERIQIR
jgi:exonuclease VII small subunit